MRCTHCGTKFVNHNNPEYTLCETCHYDKLFLASLPPVKSPYQEERKTLIEHISTLFPYPTKTYDKMNNAQLIAMLNRKRSIKK